MKRKTKIILAVIGGMIFVFLACVAFGFWYSKHHVAHGRPYRWDAYVLPEQTFSNASVSEIVAQINALVAKTSSGAVTQAVALDTTPAKIEIVPPDSPYKEEMAALIARYRQDETNWFNRGACGFETCRFAAWFLARHSLACGFQMLSVDVEMNYEEKPDAIHLSRSPDKLECRAYKISPRLKKIAESLNHKKQVRVDMEPDVSAFVDVTRVSLWSIDVPTGPNETTGEFRAASVFKYLPEKSVLLVIEKPEAHVDAEKKLKEQGFFVGP
jgi:hypothetical protein